MKKMMMILLAGAALSFTACNEKEDHDGGDDMDQLTQNEATHEEGEKTEGVEVNAVGGYGKELFFKK